MRRAQLLQLVVVGVALAGPVQRHRHVRQRLREAVVQRGPERDRVEAIGARFHLTPEPGRGTAVRVELRGTM